MDDISDRISYIVRNSGFESLRALARAADLSHTYLSQLMSDKRGRRGIGDDKAELLAKATGFSAEWIKTGKGAMRLGDAVDNRTQSQSVDPSMEEIDFISWGDDRDGEDEPPDSDDDPSQMSVGFGARLEEALKHRQVPLKYVSLMSEMSLEKLERYARKESFRGYEQPFHMVANVLGVSDEWLIWGQGSPNYDPKWRRLSKFEIKAHFAARREQFRRIHEWADALEMFHKYKSAGMLNEKEFKAAIARLELEWPKDIDDVEATGTTPTDVYPNRYRAIVMLRPHLERRMYEYLLSLKGPPHDQWSVQAWIAEAERLRSELAEVDAKWGGSKSAEPEL